MPAGGLQSFRSEPRRPTSGARQTLDTGASNVLLSSGSPATILEANVAALGSGRARRADMIAHRTMNRASDAQGHRYVNAYATRNKTLETSTVDAGRAQTRHHSRSAAENVCIRASPPGHGSRRRRWRRPDRANGPARVCMPRLQRRRPDTMAVADVLSRIDRPGDPRGVPHPYPVADPVRTR